MIIAQISDPHIEVPAEPPAVDTALQLERAVAHLRGLAAPPDVVLLTGDCTHHGRPAEYLRIRAILRGLPMPVYVIPGNHDNREQLLAAFGPQGSAGLDGFAQYVVDRGPLRLIALDTLEPGRDEGALCERRLAWLAQRLAEAPERPTVIFMHHPPMRTGLDVCDQIGLRDSERFAALIRHHPQVERILAGHLHMAVTSRFAGSLVTVCPATAHTLLPDMRQPERLAVQFEPPACLLHIWHPAAGLLSYTSPIGQPGALVELHDGTRWRS